jgi:hypothetical protein
MILVEKPLAILAALVRQTWHNPLVGLLLMVAVCAGLAWRVCTPSRSNRWVVRGTRFLSNAIDSPEATWALRDKVRRRRDGFFAWRGRGRFSCAWS